MNKKLNILLVKETKAGETRVALIPNDIKKLINVGHKVFVEHNAGSGAGFSDSDYIDSGAKIRYIKEDDSASFVKIFKDINLIVRAKRPDRKREIVENTTISKNTIMIGTLDPLVRSSSHVDEYHKSGIKAYSIDQLNLSSDNPMNLLASMSNITGKLALHEALKIFKHKVNKLVILGYGVAGKSVFNEAIKLKIPTTVILRDSKQAKIIQELGGNIFLLNKNDNLQHHQSDIRDVLLKADIVITSVRKPNSPAPLFVPNSTLQVMTKGSVIIDLALSEGGNVEGSKHDALKILGNGIVVANTSGYPKAVPKEASKLWSTATTLFILNLKETINLQLKAL
ncbi:MAG: alanine dehydrogenase [bacterium]|nr:alanine dehydrogenase [bacterium]